MIPPYAKGQNLFFDSDTDPDADDFNAAKTSTGVQHEIRCAVFTLTVGLRPDGLTQPTAARQGGRNSHCHLPSTAEDAKKDFALSKRSEFAKSRQRRGAQGSPQDQVAGCRFFWFLFFGQAKKRNKYKKMMGFSCALSIYDTGLTKPFSLPALLIFLTRSLPNKKRPQAIFANSSVENFSCSPNAKTFVCS